MNDDDEAKRRAARAALAELPPATDRPLVLGLGTGSTTRFFVDAVAELVAAGRPILGVPTSEATRAQATKLGIPLADDAGPWAIDLTVDGADEVDDGLALSKGGGGALTREKIVSFASRRTVIVCDAGKRVARLGATRPIAIEVLRFAQQTTLGHLARFGAPSLRRDRAGVPFVTDGDAFIVDLSLAAGGAADPGTLDRELHAIPGVVETGIFVGRADVVYVAYADHVERLVRR